MINIFHRTRTGAVTLVFAIILLVLCTLLIIFLANYSNMQSKTTANFNRNLQAYEAAEAGLEYAINYLDQNFATILASPVSGYLAPFSNSNTTNVALPNGASYSFVYSNPIANNYTILSITSTGTSDDGSATRVVRQQIVKGSWLVNIPATPVVAKGAVSLGGNNQITNMESNIAVVSGSTVTQGGSSTITTPAGGGPGTLSQNNSSLAAMTNTDLFTSYFGVTTAAGKAAANMYFSNSSNTNYSSNLNNQSGKFVWIDQTGGTATINGNTTIGTAASPVILVVNGDLDLSGNLTINGLIFVLGRTNAVTDITGNIQINGALISADNLGLSGNSRLTYDSTILNQFSNTAATNYFAKLPGSWKDY